MTRLVVDASVVAKWFLPELHKEAAEGVLRAFLDQTVELIAPDLIVAEVGNIFWKRCAHRDEISPAEAAVGYRDFLALQIPLYPSSPLAPSALEFAVLEHRAIYDMMYVALAQRNACELITGDQKLFRAMRSRYSRIRWIGDL